MKDVSGLFNSIFADIDSNSKSNASNTITLDYSNPLHETYFLERFGGEEFIKNNYPAVYKAFLKTKAEHQKAKSDKTEGKSLNDGKLIPNGYFVNPPQLINNKKTSNNQVETKQELIPCVTYGSNYVDNQTQLTIMINGSLVSEEGFCFLTTSEFDKLCTNLEVNEKQLLANIESIDNQKVFSKGEAYITSKDHIITTKLCNNEANSLIVDGLQTIKSFDVTAPRIKPEHTSNTMIEVAYDRPVTNYDINYTHEQVSVPNHDNLKNTFLCIEGSFTLYDDYFPIEYDDHMNPLPINLYYQKKGIANYNRTFSEMLGYFQIDKEDPKKVNFKLNEDWNYKLDKSNYSAQCIIELSCSFRYKIKNKDDDIYWVPLTISSVNKLPPDTSYYHSDGSMVYIPQINISWGCFHKNTKIKMADGNEKIISQIKENETIALKDGKSITVKSIVTGYEKKLVHIESQKGHVLEVTQTHPIVVKRGIISAENLNAADILVLPDGTSSEIKYLYMVDYNDTVYSIDTGSEGVMLIANGLLAGDYKAQNQKKEEENYIPTKEQYELMNELEELFSSTKVQI